MMRIMRAGSGRARSVGTAMRRRPDRYWPVMEAGFALAEQLLAFPHPVVVACTGHSVAMGTFLCLTGDYRLGVDGPYKIIVNEVAIGMTLPYGVIEICRQKLTPAAFTRALTLAEPTSGHAAVASGFFDRVVDEVDLLNEAAAAARRFQLLDRASFTASKQRVLGDALERVREGFKRDASDRAALLGS